MSFIINGFHDSLIRGMEHRLVQELDPKVYCAIVTDRPSSISSGTIILNSVDISLGVYPDLSKDFHVSKIYSDSYTFPKKEKWIVLRMMDRLEEHIGPLSDSQRELLFTIHLKFWSRLVRIIDFHFFLSSNIPHEVYDYILSVICADRNTPVIQLHQSIPRFVFIFKDLNPICSKIDKEYQRLLLDDSMDKTFKLSVRAGDVFRMQTGKEDSTPVYMQCQAELPSKIAPNTMKGSILKLLGNRIQLIIRSPVFWKTFFYRKVLRKVGGFDAKVLDDFYLKVQEEPEYSKPYIYFPLHYQPELTTSPLASEFVDQHRIVSLLLTSLPDDFCIYVKEHPKQGYWGRKSPMYYQKLVEHPQIKILPKDYDTYELIENCWAVATATGTAGWEAIFRNKPVLMFGDFFYRYVKGVYTIANEKQLQMAMEEINAGHVPDLKSTKTLLKAYENVSVEADYSPVYFRGSTLTPQENFNRLYKGIIDEIKADRETL